jgi:hypothetical protein
MESAQRDLKCGTTEVHYGNIILRHSIYIGMCVCKTYTSIYTLYLILFLLLLFSLIPPLNYFIPTLFYTPLKNLEDSQSMTSENVTHRAVELRNSTSFREIPGSNLFWQTSYSVISWLFFRDSTLK